MGIISASGGVIRIKGTDGVDYQLNILTMAQIAALSSVWLDRLRKKFINMLNDLSVTVGQRLIAMREFEMLEPSFHDTVNFAITPNGIDETILLAVRANHPDFSNADITVLGDVWERRELASRLVQLVPVNGQKVDSLADPTDPTIVKESKPSATGT